MNAIGETSFNVGTCCNANCRRIDQVALQITLYPGYSGTQGFSIHVPTVHAVDTFLLSNTTVEKQPCQPII